MNIFEKADKKLLPNFERHFINVNGNNIRALTCGNGPALLMLHGDPQTHLCWHHLAPKLTDNFTVVLTDLRGRGETHKPAHDPAKNAYTKREMAAEQVSVMQALGHKKFSIISHDRGARVARRIALDFPEIVTQLVVMDIVPELDFYENTNAQIAHDYFHFSFLTQDYPAPDRLIAGDVEEFMKQILFGLSKNVVKYDPLALEAYLEATTTPEAITAMCDCFRAGYHIDQLHDKADQDSGRKIICPTLVMWGEYGVIGRYFDVTKIWNNWCTQPQFAAMPSGHFIPEEAPDATYAAVSNFLKQA